jgi:hypothetical protein
MDTGPHGPWRRSDARPANTIVNYLPAVFHRAGVSLASMEEKVPDVEGSSYNPITPTQLILDNYQRLVNLIHAASHPFYALSPFFKLAIISEMNFLKVVGLKIREELNHDRLSSSDNPTLSNLLYNQQVLKRHVRNLKESICFMEEKSKRPWCGRIIHKDDRRGAGTHTLTSILKDYRAAVAYAKSLIADCDQGISIVAHNATIRESQKAIAEAQAVKRLSKLAAIFIPLSFATSIFSMNVTGLRDNDGPALWTWFLTCFVFGAGAFVYIRPDLVWRARDYYLRAKRWYFPEGSGPSRVEGKDLATISV